MYEKRTPAFMWLNSVECLSPSMVFRENYSFRRFDLHFSRAAGRSFSSDSLLQGDPVVRQIPVLLTCN